MERAMRIELQPRLAFWRRRRLQLESICTACTLAVST